MKGCNGMTGRILSQIFDFLKLVKPTGGEKFLMAIGGFIGGVFSFVVGGVDDAMIWLIILVVIDYISGSAASFLEHNWCSERGFCGLFKKLFVFLVVAICNGIYKATGQDILRNIAIFAYAVNEAGSILENVERVGLRKWIPPFMKAELRILKDKEVDMQGEKKKENKYDQN